MPFVKKRLLDMTQVASAAPASNPMLANPSGKTTLVQLITAHNPDASATRDLTGHRVPDSAGAAGTADAANQALKASVSPEETLSVELPGGGWVLEDAGDTVQFAVSGALNLAVDGTEVS